jgi:hypothetical protein
MKLATLLILIACLLCVNSKAEHPFICKISTDQSIVFEGEIPRVEVSITNRSGKDVYLVGSLDGSDVGWRFPKCGFDLLDTEGKPIPQTKPMLRCGNMNPLKAEDFVKVPAGKTFSPTGSGFFGSWQLYRFQELPPGVYVLRFYYQTSTKGIDDYFGDERMFGQKVEKPELLRFFEAVPLVDIKSNDLRITVKRK